MSDDERKEQDEPQADQQPSHSLDRSGYRPSHLDAPFLDQATGRMMKFTKWGTETWLVYRHPDGQWVSLRRPTNQDYAVYLKALGDVAMSRFLN